MQEGEDINEFICDYWKFNQTIIFKKEKRKESIDSDHFELEVEYMPSSELERGWQFFCKFENPKPQECL